MADSPGKTESGERTAGAALVERGPVGRGARPRGKGGSAVSESPDMSAGSARSIKGRGFFELYKRGQGYFTRTGTAIGAGVLLAGLYQFIYDTLSFDQGWAPGLYLKIGIPLAVVLALALVVWWLVGVHRRTCDFMIHTDGEMKKVNWSTQKEIIASTKVVIVVTLLMAGALFLVDWAFMNFFQIVGVLRAGGAS